MKNKSKQSLWVIFKSSITEFFEEGAFFHGAALSYYTLFALIPLLYLTVISFGQIFGEEICINAITSIFEKNIGIEDISIFTEYLKKLNNQSKSIKLNIIMIFAFSFIENWLSSTIGNIHIGFILFHHIFSMLMNLLIIAFIFKFVHDGSIAWKLAFKGALLTSLLLFISQVIIKYYLQNYFFLGKGDVVGSMFILMAWVFYSAQVIFFGAKFTYVYGKSIHQVPQ